jgi:hypothetical protein
VGGALSPRCSSRTTRLPTGKELPIRDPCARSRRKAEYSNVAEKVQECLVLESILMGCSFDYLIHCAAECVACCACCSQVVAAAARPLDAQARSALRAGLGAQGLRPQSPREPRHVCGVDFAARRAPGQPHGAPRLRRGVPVGRAAGAGRLSRRRGPQLGGPPTRRPQPPVCGGQRLFSVDSSNHERPRGPALGWPRRGCVARLKQPPT